MRHRKPKTQIDYNAENGKLNPRAAMKHNCLKMWACINSVGSPLANCQALFSRARERTSRDPERCMMITTHDSPSTNPMPRNFTSLELFHEQPIGIQDARWALYIVLMVSRINLSLSLFLSRHHVISVLDSIQFVAYYETNENGKKITIE